MKTLSTVMLVKNAASYIEPLLKVARTISNELIVAVDAASEDSTQDIASRFADRTIMIDSPEYVEEALPWMNEQCSGDWILRLDADEMPSQALCGALPALLEDKEYTHYYIRMRWLLNEKQWLNSRPWWPGWQLRLFRNIPSLIQVPGDLHSGYVISGAGKYIEHGSIYHYDLVLHDESLRRAKIAHYAKIRPSKCFGGHYFPSVGEEFLSELPADDEPARIPEAVRSSIGSSSSPASIRYGKVEKYPANPTDSFFKASLQCGYYPDVIQVGQTARIEVYITNEGDAIWPVCRDRSSVVRLSYHWLRGDGSMAVFDGVRTYIPAPLKGGNSMIVFAVVVAPSEPGEYVLQLDLVVENVSWFSSKGLVCPKGKIRIVEWLVSEERMAGVRYQIGLSRSIKGRERQGFERHRPPCPFIVGTGRCGTTLLRLMLDSHPDMAIGPEAHTFPRAYEACKGAADPAKAFLGIVTSSVTWSDFHLSEQELSAAVRKVEPFHLGECYRVFYNLYAKKQGKRRWGDKTPAYIHSMINIQEQIPEAHFIHLIRDGRDVALSVKDLWWGPSTIDECAVWWSDTIRLARNFRFALTNYLEIRYEDLVRDPAGVLREICSFINLDWCVEMLTYYLNAGERLKEYDRAKPSPIDQSQIGAEKLQGIHDLVKGPPRIDRIDRWRKEMGETDLHAFERVAGELLLDLGYSLHN